MKAASIGIAIALIAASALFASGHQVAATAVGIGAAIVLILWRKVLGKIGVRSSR